MPDLVNEIKKLIIDELELEDISIEKKICNNSGFKI